MHEIILHLYDLSPYAEKIRLALGRKSQTWRSVATPMVMPKPDHVELTGGYRRVPVLQIGADIYCDTHWIAHVHRRSHPERAVGLRDVEVLELERDVVDAARLFAGRRGLDRAGERVCMTIGPARRARVRGAGWGCRKALQRGALVPPAHRERDETSREE